ncbi:MAG: L-seryl-tRNA(Sec) selenium transferase [Chloroflexota bacterium]|nr:L-seryl-tRNA(Sec) selenium transferase [Chloroflexota bacterium]
MDRMESEFRNLPSVDKLLSDNRIKQLREIYPHDLIVDLIRQHLEQVRRSITLGNPCPSLDEIIDTIDVQLQALVTSSLRPVINASGVIIHTNLGRAPLSKEAIAAMDMAARGYCNLEIDLDSNTRGSRNIHVEQLLCQLTGAEAALVVNNNASAVLLALTVLARKREVVVPRGQAVEIGGGFRIPEIMKQSGAKLIEVGTTNCTYTTDYEQAIGQRTAALLQVHSSNFKIVGFTHGVSLEELIALGGRYDIPVFDDVGSGCLLDTTQFGLASEPMVQNSVALGVSLVFFSGDKLLGGPQAGIIAGKKEYIDKLKKHPLTRALRMDKIGLAGLSATLIHYIKGEAVRSIPVWRMISTPLDEIERRATVWAESLGDRAQVMDGESMVGGGSLPGGTLPTKLVAIGRSERKSGQHAAQVLARRLRLQNPPVLGHISGNVVLLDPRTVLPEEDLFVIQALRTAVFD